MKRYAMQWIIIATFAVLVTVAHASAAGVPNGKFYYTGAQLANPKAFVRIDSTHDPRGSIQQALVVQGSCWFNGRGYADVPRWSMTVDLENHAPLRKAELYVVAFNPSNLWRMEMRKATSEEVSHYRNCDWPRDAWAYSQTDVLTNAVGPLDTAIGIQTAVDARPGPHDAQIVQIVARPCPRKLGPGEHPITVMYLPSRFRAVRSGDVLVPSGTSGTYSLETLILGDCHLATSTELKHYRRCDWPASMMRP